VRRRFNRYATRRVEPFTSERDLCEVLREVSTALGWAFYPETGGWDAILVLEDETQVGVQAKLRANVDVLAQAIVPPLRHAGPDIHAILVPECSRAFRAVAAELDVAVLVGDVLRRARREPGTFGGGAEVGRRYLETVVARAPRRTHLGGRCWLPPFVPDGPAGVPAPRSVSPWRVAAAKLCAELRTGLQPTNAELRERGLSPSTWTTRWLEPIPGTRPRRYRPRTATVLPDVAFPEVAAGLGLPVPSREPVTRVHDVSCDLDEDCTCGAGAA
jgi:hypothetical protein